MIFAEKGLAGTAYPSGLPWQYACDGLARRGA